MYERRVSLQELTRGSIDRDAIKRAVDSLMMEPHTDVARDYSWFRHGNVIVIRTEHHRPFFERLKLPKKGATVSFSADAAPKRGHTKSPTRNRTRRPLFASIGIEAWARPKLADAGLDVIEIDTVSFETQISSRAKLQCGAIVGEAVITNLDLLSNLLLHGLPAAGPKCWGFGAVMIEE